MTAAGLAPFLVLVSAALHAIWNAYLKQRGDRFAVLAVLNLVGGVMAFPFLFFVPFPDANTWGWIGLSFAAHLIYQSVLVRSYELGEMSLVYPFARGLGPILVALSAPFLLGDHITFIGGFGVFLVATGIWSLAFSGPGDAAAHPHRGQALMFAGATGCMIAIYTMIDAAAMRDAVQPEVFIAWSFAAFVPVFTLLAWLRMRNALWSGMAAVWKPGAVVGVLASIGYALAMYAFAVGNVSRLAALRETSIVFATLIAIFVLKEKAGFRRIAAALVITGGAVLTRY